MGLWWFYGGLMVFYGGLMGIYGNLWDLPSGKHTKNYGKSPC